MSEPSAPMTRGSKILGFTLIAFGLILLLLVGSLAATGHSAPATAPNRVEVAFAEPEKFTDVRRDFTSGQNDPGTLADPDAVAVGAVVPAAGCIIELTFLEGRKHVSVPVEALLKYDS